MNNPRGGGGENDAISDRTPRSLLHHFSSRNVTIPTSNYSQSIWGGWFVLSFTDMAANIAKSFKLLSLLRGGRDEGGWVLYVNCWGLNVTIPTSKLRLDHWNESLRGLNNLVIPTTRVFKPRRDSFSDLTDLEPMLGNAGEAAWRVFWLGFRPLEF